MSWYQNCQIEYSKGAAISGHAGGLEDEPFMSQGVLSPRRASAFVLAASLAILSGVPGKERAQTRSPQEDAFPLRTGACWVYEGTVRWAGNTADEGVEKKIQWKMEVVDTLERRSLTAYVLKGHPLDLAWYTEGKQRGDYVIVRIGGDKYYLVQEERVAEVLRRVRDAQDELKDLVDNDDLFLDLPLEKGKAFGESDQLNCEDGMYCWRVGASREADLRGIKGVTGQKAAVWELSYRTNPDVQIVDYAPKIGILRFQYHHNGTVSDCDVHLVEYSPGKPQQQK
jgi:hypothetical protein